MCRCSIIRTRGKISARQKLCANDNEGANFWLKVMTELKNRGVQDILLAVVDGLKGFPEAISYSLSFAGWSERKHLAKALRAIYCAPSAQAAARELDAFAESDGGVSIRQLSTPGGAIGSRSSRSSPSLPKSAKLSTRQTLLRACICKCAK
jgi:hypothetical protein